MKSEDHKSKVSHHIPIKNVEIHQPVKNDAYNPRDQIYVRKVKGVFQRLRQKMNFFFLALFAVLPWLQYNGHQAILFDISEQRFTLWSVTLWPQDLNAFGLALSFSARFYCILCHHLSGPGLVWLPVSTNGLDLHFYLV